jgi:hypothetical protein
MSVPQAPMPSMQNAATAFESVVLDQVCQLFEEEASERLRECRNSQVRKFEFSMVPIMFERLVFSDVGHPQDP